MFGLVSALSKFLTSKLLRELDDAPPSPLGLKGTEVSLYLHVPFCRRLCKFCHFVRYPFRYQTVKAYFKRLRGDLEELLQRDLDVKEVYVGGGSPSCLPNELGELLDEAWSFWKPLTSVEVAPADVVELNALDFIDPKKVKRVSMGIQSLRAERLERLGRGTDLETSLEALEVLKSKGYEVINADFIWDVDVEIEELEEIADLGVRQPTLYPLMPPSPRGSEGERFELYKRIVEVMGSRGYRRTNAWTFSKGRSDLYDEYVSKGRQFVGIGVSAISLYSNRLSINTFDVEKYLASPSIVHEHSLKLGFVSRKALKLAYDLHKRVSRFERLNYSSLIALREAYTALGEYRIEKRDRYLVRGVGFEPTQAYASGS